MNKFSRISLAAMTCGALCLAYAQAHAQSTGVTGVTGVGGTSVQADPSNNAPATGTSGGGMSNSLGGSGSPSGGSAYPSGSSYSTGSALEPLPTEPTAAGYTSARYSWIPYTTAGYVGLSIGNGSLKTPCVANQVCDDPDGAVNIYTGGMFTPYFGLQLGYFRLGDADRNGGTTKVSGANISLVGVIPMGTSFSLVGRVGGTYAWTDVEAPIGVSGEEEEFGAAYGVGVSWDFHNNWSATLDWDRHHMKFAGIDGRKKTEIATIGIKYRF